MNELRRIYKNRGSFEDVRRFSPVEQTDFHYHIYVQRAQLGSMVVACAIRTSVRFLSDLREQAVWGFKNGRNMQAAVINGRVPL